MYALGLVPGLLLSGPLSDCYGRRALVFPATVVTLLASALLGAGGGSFKALLCGRLLYGVGAGAAMNPGAVWLLDLSAGAAPGARRATRDAGALRGVRLRPAAERPAGPVRAAPDASCPTSRIWSSRRFVFALALRAPAPPRAPARPGPLLRIGLDRTNRGPFLRGVVWMAPFVFAFPGIAFATLPALAGGQDSAELRGGAGGAHAGGRHGGAALHPANRAHRRRPRRAARRRGGRPARRRRGRLARHPARCWPPRRCSAWAMASA